MKIYAKCPPTKCEYLTGGKEYEVFDENGELFHINDNVGDVVVENWIDGLHAKGRWERIVREDAGDDTITLRDEFAMAALPAIIKAVCDGKHEPHIGLSREIGITMDAYTIADAMMEARKS